MIFTYTTHSMCKQTSSLTPKCTILFEQKRVKKKKRGKKARRMKEFKTTK